MPEPTAILPADGFNELAICRHGPMLFNRHDQYIGASLRKYGEFSPGEYDLFRQIVTPGMTVLEIGANIGAHTVELSRLAGPAGVVHAFEPQRIMFQLLCANLALNSRTNVFAHPLAVGEARATASIPAPDPNRPANFGGVSMLSAAPGEKVQVVRIDDFALPACHVIKIDVEGMEAPSLRGAAETIRRLRPVLYVENDRQQNSPVLIALLLEFRYRLVLAYAAAVQRAELPQRPREHLSGSCIRSTCSACQSSVSSRLPGFSRSTGRMTTGGG